MSKFTPEDVVAAYKRLGVRARTGTTNLKVKDGVLQFKPGATCCCALGAICAGDPADPDSPDPVYDAVVARGVNWFEFTAGFDDGFRPEEHHPDRDLGVACRAAVIAAGLVDPTYW